MKRLILLPVLASALVLVMSGAASAQTAISVADSAVRFEYPPRLTFSAKATSSAEINRVDLVVRFPKSGAFSRARVDQSSSFKPGPQVDANVVWNLRTPGAFGGYLPPGATGEFGWHVEDKSGNTFDSP